MRHPRQDGCHGQKKKGNVQVNDEKNEVENVQEDGERKQVALRGSTSSEIDTIEALLLRWSSVGHR